MATNYIIQKKLSCRGNVRHKLSNSGVVWSIQEERGADTGNTGFLFVCDGVHTQFLRADFANVHVVYI